jgi:hemerythrin-like domain-containing protein
MKRIKQLQPLSMEHHLSLSLAANAIRTAQNGDPDAIHQLCSDIIEDYDKTWRPHFDHEERLIFEPFADRSEKIQQMCAQLTDEHRRFDDMVDQMKAGKEDILLEFGELLKAHTRREERELFPLISVVLTTAELDGIYQGLTG